MSNGPGPSALKWLLAAVLSVWTIWLVPLSNAQSRIILDDVPLHLVVNAGPDLYDSGDLNAKLGKLGETLSRARTNGTKVRAVTLYISWSRFQRLQNLNGASPSDFSVIDKVLSLVVEHRKASPGLQLNIGLLPGCWTPDWVTPVIQTPRIKWKGGCAGGAPLPWDYKYLTQFKSAVNSLATHFRGLKDSSGAPLAAALGYIAITGPSLANGLEMNLPLSPTDDVDRKLFCSLGATTSEQLALCASLPPTNPACNPAESLKCSQKYPDSLDSTDINNWIRRNNCKANLCQPLVTAKTNIDLQFVSAWKRAINIFALAFSDPVFSNLRFAVALHTILGPFVDRSNSDTVAAYAREKFGERFVPMALYLDHKAWFQKDAMQVKVITDQMAFGNTFGFQSLYTAYHALTELTPSQRSRCMKLATQKAGTLGAQFVEFFWRDYDLYASHEAADELPCPSR